MFHEIKVGVIALSVLLTACGGGIGDSPLIDTDPALTSLQKNDGTYVLSISNTEGACGGYSITTYYTTAPERLDLITVEISSGVDRNGSTGTYYTTVYDTAGRTFKETAGLILKDSFSQSTSFFQQMTISGDRLTIVASGTENDMGDSYGTAWIDNLVFSGSGFSGDYGVGKTTPNSGPNDSVSCSENGTVTGVKI